jgi:hypothetical protein
MLFRALLYVNVLGGLSVVAVCALAPFADSIKKLVSTVRAHAVAQHSASQTVRHGTVRA